jgi:ATP phosphoribosyltransferase regulatory subunit
VPAGVLALVGNAARRQRETEQRCLALLTDAGFELVHLPVLEFAESATGAGYRFVDRGGQLLALRTDFTPLAARVLSPTLESSALPLAVCYAGEVVRPQPARLRQLPELYQLGFESYGATGGGVRALELTIRLLSAAGVKPACCHVSVSVAGLVEEVLGQMLEQPADEELLELVRVRDLDALAEALALRGRTLDMLEGALLGRDPARWAEFFGVGAQLERLQPLLACAAHAGLAAGVELAPRLVGGYYQGAVFSVWGRHTRAVLAGGGEYEVALRRGPLPAAGASLALGVALEEAAC